MVVDDFNLTENRTVSDEPKWAKSRADDKNTRSMHDKPKTNAATLGCAGLRAASNGFKCRESVMSSNRPDCAMLLGGVNVLRCVKSSIDGEKTKPVQDKPGIGTGGPRQP